MTINGGTLLYDDVADPGDGLGSGNLTITNGVLENYWSDTFSRSLGAGAGQFRITGGTSGFSGQGNSGMTVRLNNNAAFEVVWGSAHFNPTTLVLQAATANTNGDVVFQNRVDLNGVTRTIAVNNNNEAAGGTAQMTGIIRDTVGSAGIIKNGVGLLILTAANEFTGGVTINNGTIRVSNATALGNGGPVSFAGATTKLDLRSNLNIGNLSGTGGNGLITAGAAGARILTVNQTGDTTFGGVIENGLGSVSLVKNGGGALTLDGAHTYTGATTINGGKLIVNGSLAAGSAVSINNGTLGGNGTINGALTLNALDDILSPGNSPDNSPGILSFGSGQTWSSFTYDWKINNWPGAAAGTDFDQIAIAGSLDLSATTVDSYLLDLQSLTAGNVPGDVFNFTETGASWSILTARDGITGFDASEWQIDASGFTNNELGTWSLGLGNQNNDLVLTYTAAAAAAAVPEPATAALALMGLAGLMMRRRRMA